jgi:membrane-bound metal-dependent hydrolase YbcI (DUF457 family)
MTRNGHFITGAILAATSFAITSSYGLLVGFIIGSSAPDNLEMSSYNKRSGSYNRLIPHRTLTHWPFLWIGGIYALYHYKTDITAIATHIGWEILLGYCLSAVLHLIMDIGTPMGIPIFTPFGKRYSLNFYSTGKGEWIPITLLIMLSGTTMKYQDRLISTYKSWVSS